MSKRIIPAITAAGLLALAPAFAQSQGSNQGTGNQGTGTAAQGTPTGSGSHDTSHGGSSGMTTQGSHGGAHEGSQGTAARGATGQSATGHDHGAHGSTIDPKGTDHANQDQHFLHEAATGGMMEVELGRLAAERAASAEVKAFGQRMVTDHGKANQQLMQIATSKGITLPKALPAEKQRERDLFARLSGAEFDRMYMDHMVKDHKKDVSEFEKQAEKGTDTALRSFAQQTLPTLREHLTLAQSLAGKQAKK